MAKRERKNIAIERKSQNNINQHQVAVPNQPIGDSQGVSTPNFKKKKINLILMTDDRWQHY